MFNIQCTIIQSADVTGGGIVASRVAVNTGTQVFVSNKPWELQFEVQISRVTGVPAEMPHRSKDVMQRGVRFCLCRTETPPTADHAGDPPQFLGNVVKLEASIADGKI